MNGYYVYKHTTPNNKSYVGITKQNPKARWKNGYGYASNPYFYNAILKYGWNNIEHKILAKNLSLKDACSMEKQLIANLNLTNREFGYNVCNGGEGTNGYHHTKEYKEKLRLRNKNMSNKTRNKISETVKKYWKDGLYDNRKTTSHIPWNKGLTKEDERVAKYCRKQGEFHHTTESRKKMSEHHKGIKPVNCKKIQCVETGVVYDTVAQATKITGISNLSKAARFGNCAGKLHWRYINE